MRDNGLQQLFGTLSSGLFERCRIIFSTENVQTLDITLPSLHFEADRQMITNLADILSKDRNIESLAITVEHVGRGISSYIAQILGSNSTITTLNLSLPGFGATDVGNL